MDEPATAMLIFEIASSGDAEIDAIQMCTKALSRIDEKNARDRVVAYLARRFGRGSTTELRKTPQWQHLLKSATRS